MFSSRTLSLSLGLAAVALVSLGAARPASAQTAIQLFNTGVNNNGTVAALGSVDQHYTQITPTGNPSAYLYNFPTYAAPTNSQYISVDANGGNNYMFGFFTADYQTTFSLPTLTPSTLVSLSGDWSTDNRGDDILINGHSTGLMSPGYGAFTHFDLTPFQNDFQAGTNTLDFVWTNAAGPGAIDVQNLQGTVGAPVPEASTTVSLGLLLALGMGGLLVAAKRKKAGSLA